MRLADKITLWVSGLGLLCCALVVAFAPAPRHFSPQEEADRVAYVWVQDKLYITYPLPDSLYLCRQDSTGTYCQLIPTGCRIMAPVPNGEGY